MMKSEWKEELEAAIGAASRAGEQIREWIGRPLTQAAKSSRHDLVTEVDKACQDIIATHLVGLFPESTLLGEETVAPGSEAAAEATLAADTRFLWVVDPIDGTQNFIRGVPFCAVSIGLVVAGEPVAGVIYDPLRDEMFYGAKDLAMQVDGVAAGVSNETSVEDAILASGFPNGTYRKQNVRQVERFAHSARSVRALGSAALHLAYVACGRIDGFFENDLNAWDLCAGVVLVQAGGGRVTGTAGEPYNLALRHVVASNGLIHDEILSDLRSLDD
jgi:myo-inositol-1(or 4)-monophosphatase